MTVQAEFAVAIIPTTHLCGREFARSTAMLLLQQ